MNNITELVFVLDCSGSMYSLTQDTIGGFNAMLQKQRAQEGKVYVSTVLFNSTSRVLHDRVDIDAVPEMTEADYHASGNTALIDALGGAIHHIGNIHKYARPEDVPAHTLFVITTDGMENASHIYTADKVRSMIRLEKEKYGWEFLFLAANIDAVQTARRYGISQEASVDYRCDSAGIDATYAGISQAIINMRKTGAVGSWRKNIDDDYNGRK